MESFRAQLDEIDATMSSLQAELHTKLAQIEVTQKRLADLEAAYIYEVAQLPKELVFDVGGEKITVVTSSITRFPNTSVRSRLFLELDLSHRLSTVNILPYFDLY